MKLKKIHQAWEENLDPAQKTINFKTVKGKAEEVTFFEFPKKTLQDYIEKVYNTPTTERRKLTEEEVAAGMKPESAAFVQIPYTKLAETLDKELYGFFVKATHGEKNEKYFKDLFETGGGLATFSVFAHFIEVIEEINCINEIAQTAGNWALLPESIRISAAEKMQKQKNETAEAQSQN